MTDTNDSTAITEAIDALDRALMASPIPSGDLVEVRIMLRFLKAEAVRIKP